MNSAIKRQHLAAWDLLAAGHYARGLRLWEATRFSRGTNPTPKPKLSFPEWQGQDVGSLLVLAEQGLGDQIQFVRFLPALTARGITTTLFAAPSLMPLFTGLATRLLPTIGVSQLDRHDAWTMIGSLPYRLGVTLETLDGRPYLHAPSDVKREASGAHFGVIWRGNPTHAHDAHRSMSDQAVAPLLAMPGAISLHPEDTGARDFGDTAAIIAGLDAVVSVDTSVAHLAGAMGKKTLIMLPAAMPDWRWLRGRKDSPWYASVKLYRQPRPGDWGAVTDAVVADLMRNASDRSA